MIRFLSRGSLILWIAVLAAVSVHAERFQIRHDDQAVIITAPDGVEAVRYQLVRPKGSSLSVDSACYFHPFRTPAGTVVTEVAPPDHRQHRGIFLAWVEMHGSRDGDFWGWGETAPITNRVVVNRGLRNMTSTIHGARFIADNEWLADGVVVMRERLDARVSRQGAANILDLSYQLIPATDTTLSRWAFSGFSVRGRKDGSVTALAPEGPVHFPPPKTREPDSNWPARPWYAYRFGLPEGVVATVALRCGPENPPATWHNLVDIGLLNPAITAPAAVQLKQGRPFELHYRVVAADGEVPARLLD